MNSIGACYNSIYHAEQNAIQRKRQYRDYDHHSEMSLVYSRLEKAIEESEIIEMSQHDMPIQTRARRALVRFYNRH